MPTKRITSAGSSTPQWLQTAIRKGKGIFERGKSDAPPSAESEDIDPSADRVYAPSFAHILAKDWYHPSPPVQDAPITTGSSPLSDEDIRSLASSVPSKPVNNSMSNLTQMAYTFHSGGKTYRIVPNINPECTAKLDPKLPDASVFGMFISGDPNEQRVQFRRGGGPWIGDATSCMVDGVQVTTQMVYAYSPCLMSVKVQEWPTSLTETEPDLLPGSWFRFGSMQSPDDGTGSHLTSDEEGGTKRKIETFCELDEVTTEPVSEDFSDLLFCY